MHRLALRTLSIELLIRLPRKTLCHVSSPSAGWQFARRAADAIKEIVLPNLKELARVGDRDSIAYVGMFVGLMHADSSEEIPQPKGDCVTFIARTALVKEFLSKDITDDELVQKADVFVLNGDDVKKITVVLQ